MKAENIFKKKPLSPRPTVHCPGNLGHKYTHIFQTDFCLGSLGSPGQCSLPCQSFSLFKVLAVLVSTHLQGSPGSGQYACISSVWEHT